MTTFTCPVCKGNKLLLGYETFTLDDRIFISPVLKCFSCGSFNEPSYSTTRKEDRMWRDKPILQIIVKYPAAPRINRFKILNKMNDRHFEYLMDVWV